MGSDYPFPLGEHHPGKLIESIEDWEWSKKVCCFYVILILLILSQEKLLSNNALEFLGLKKSEFEIVQKLQTETTRTPSETTTVS